MSHLRLRISSFVRFHCLLLVWVQRVMDTTSNSNGTESKNQQSSAIKSIMEKKENGKREALHAGNTDLNGTPEKRRNRKNSPEDGVVPSLSILEEEEEDGYRRPITIGSVSDPTALAAFCKGIKAQVRDSSLSR